MVDTAHEELQAVIARALVEPSFCDALLNGGREACLSEFALTATARAAARSVEANSLQDYASQIEAWLQTQRERSAVMPFAYAMPARMAAAA